MAVSSTTTRNDYLGAGSVGPYAYTFRIFAATDLVVTKRATSGTETTLLYPSGYTVSGVGDTAGGAVTLSTALAVGETLTIQRELPLTQATSLRNAGAYLASAHEDQLDRLVMIDQQQQDALDRTLKLGPTLDPDDYDLILPAPETGKVLTGTGTGFTMTTLDSSAVSLPGNGRTVTTLSAYLANNADFNPKDWGALGAGTNDAAAIQATIDALNVGTTKGGRVVFRGTPDTYYGLTTALVLPKRAGGDNHSRWYALTGDGRSAPLLLGLAGMEGKSMLDASGTPAVVAPPTPMVANFYREIKDLYFAGNGHALRGIDLRYNQHFKCENLFIEQMVDSGGALTASAIEVYGAICAQFLNVKVSGTNGHGLYAGTDSSNFFNANLVSGCSFLSLTGDGFHSDGGVTGCTFIGNTYELCRYGMYLAGYSSGGNFCAGSYFEQNSTADVYLGALTTLKLFTLASNQFNGYGGATGAAFTPIVMKFCDGCVIEHNQISQPVKSATGYYILDANVAGGSVTNNTVRKNWVSGLSPATAGNTIYNLPGSWVDNGNELIDDVFAPLITNNVVRQRLPYGGWTITVSGTGAVVKSDVTVMGGATTRMTRPAASGAAFSRNVTIGPEFKGRFVTFAVPVRARVAAKSFQVNLNTDGTGPGNTTVDESTLAAGAERIVYAMCYVPADATTITVQGIVGALGDFDIGQPCLYVGARRWYSAGSDEYASSAAPTTGTWAVADRVWNTSGTAGQPIAWVCSVAGTPGTWRVTGWVPGSFGDNANTSIVLTATTEPTLRYDTALTANRTVTLPARSASVTGQKFRIVRTGLGAFTLSVQEAAGDGGTVLKAIPNTTAAFVDVEFDTGGTSQWRLAAYGTL